MHQYTRLMPAIMSVLDVFELAECGVVIAGSNPRFNELKNEAIQEIIGKALVIQLPQGEELSVNVVEVDIARSLVDQVNISILLEHTVDLEKIKIGSQVLSLENPEES